MSNSKPIDDLSMDVRLPTGKKIAVVGPALRSAGGLSVGANMVRAVCKIAPDNEYLFILPQAVGYEDIVKKLRCYSFLGQKELGFIRRLFHQNFVVPKIIRDFEPDVILGITALGVRNTSIPQSVLVDQPQLIYSDSHLGPRSLFDKIRHVYIRWHFRSQLKNTSVVLCRTPIVEKRIKERYQYNGRLLVCGASVSAHLISNSATPDISPAYQAVVERYQDCFKLLYVSRYYPHKNYEGIIRLFREKHKELENVVLFITISEGEHKNVVKIFEAIDRYNLKESIVNVGNVPHEDIGWFYKSCDAMFMPTLLETLGVPYLEAMHARIPIITSDYDFARASCGDGALYCDPTDSESMVVAIRKLKDDPDRSASLVSAQDAILNHANQSWNDVARKVLGELFEFVT